MLATNPMTLSQTFIDEYERSLQQAGEEALDWAQHLAQEAGVPVKRKLVRGSPAPAILAEAKPTDLIAMGTHGRNSLAAFVLGSVTLRVLHEAPCPVVAVPSHPHVLGPDGQTGCGRPDRSNGVQSREREAHAPGWDAKSASCGCWASPEDPIWLRCSPSRRKVKLVATCWGRIRRFPAPEIPGGNAFGRGQARRWCSGLACCLVTQGCGFQTCQHPLRRPLTPALIDYIRIPTDSSLLPM